MAMRYDELCAQVTAAIIEQARLLHEETSERPSDGIDDPDTYEGSQMRTGPLHPTTWFEPLRGASPVNPLAAR